MSANELHALHRRVPLGTLARFDNGAAFKPTEWESTGRPIIRIQNLTDRSAPFNRTTKALPEKVQIRHGELLYSWSASLGVHIWAGEDAVLNQHIFKVTPTPAVEKEYLYYLLDHVTYELQAKTHGSTMKHVTKGDFESTMVPVPPFHEQRRIVEILNRANGIRRLRSEALAKTGQLIPALFAAMFGSTSNERCWPMRKLDQISTISYGLAAKLDQTLQPSEGVRTITISNVTLNGSLDLSVARYTKADSDNSRKASLKEGDLLFNWRNGSADHIGKTAIVPELAAEWLHVSFLLRVRPDRSVLDPIYGWVLFNQLRSRGLFKAQSRMQVNRKFNASELSALEIPLPPADVQRAFSRRINDIQSIIAEQQRAVITADQLVASLMVQCFEG